MPVVNLQHDNRWGDIGQGLGAIGGQIVDAVRKKQMAADVAQTLQDPNIAEAKKGVKILEQHGNEGYELYKQQIATQALQTKMKEAEAQTRLTDTQNQLASEKLKNTPAEFAANLALTQQTARNIGSQASARDILLPGQVAEQTATTTDIGSRTTARDTLLPVEKAQGEATTAGTVIKTSGQSIANELAEISLKSIKGSMNEEDLSSNLDGLIKKFGYEPNSSLGQIAKAKFAAERDPLKKASAFADVFKGVAEAGERTPVPADARKQMIQSGEAAVSMDKFVNAFSAGGAQKIGAVSGAGVQKFLEKYGWGTGDPEFLQMLNSSIQSAASVATQGGGFYSPGRFALGKDVTPGILESPLHAAVAMDEVVSRQIAGLEAGKSSAPMQARAGYDAQIAKWKSIEKKMDFKAYDFDPQGKGKTVVFFGGKEVDAKDFKPKNTMLDTGSKTKTNSTISATDLRADAERLKVDPALRLKAIQEYYRTH